MIRPATAADVAAIRAILAAHDEDGPVTGADIVGPYVRHLIEHGVALVSERAGEVVAYGSAVDAGPLRHLADLFVRPDLLGQGRGRPLLEAVMGEARQRTTFASEDPRALPLYVRAGMRPLWPVLFLEGPATLIPERAPSYAAEAAEADHLAALELAWSGAERTLDHRFWASQAEADSFVVLEAGEPVAVGHARARQVGSARAIDRLLIRPGADPVAPALVALHRAARGGVAMAFVAGPSPLLPVLVRAGFRVKGVDQFMASDEGLVDPARLLPNPGML